MRAVGETGLDYYRDSAPPDIQRDWFRAHIDIAKSAGKALMIHDRDAHEDVLAILARAGRAASTSSSTASPATRSWPGAARRPATC